MTGKRALPTLDAAHILPVKKGGQHRLDNGLLLRTDVHRLFDNGPFHGQRIRILGDPASQPNRTALEWHGDVRVLR